MSTRQKVTEAWRYMVGGAVARGGKRAVSMPPSPRENRCITVSCEVIEARVQLIELARRGKLHSHLRTEFGYWKPQPLRAAKVIPVSTWALKLGGLASCAVCGKSLKDEVSVPHGRCALHADWEIVWDHHSGSDAESDNSIAAQLRRIVARHESQTEARTTGGTE